MERLQKFFLSTLAFAMLFACSSKEEKVADASEFGFHFYQGTPQHMNAFAYVIELDTTNADAWRELSIPYLKRGIPHHWKKYMEEVVRNDSALWQPYRGYNYLWFYRDYKKAIEDFNASDTLTPDFIDAPQGHSVDYWRGIAYLGLKDYENSIAYFDKHITKETQESGEDWVELEAFLYKGIAHYENNEPLKSLESLNKQLLYSKNRTADGKYYKVLLYKDMDSIAAARELIESAISDFENGYYNSRPYVETLRQIYMEDLVALQKKLQEL